MSVSVLSRVFVVAAVTQVLSQPQLFLGCLTQGGKVESDSSWSS